MGTRPTCLKTFSELSALWENLDLSSRRLLVYAPDVAPWTDMQTSWENVVHVVSKAGQGLGELDYAEILEVIANSI